jgi:hypothetical protein
MADGGTSALGSDSDSGCAERLRIEKVSITISKAAHHPLIISCKTYY